MTVPLEGVSPTLLKALSVGDCAVLEQHGVHITIAEGTHHSKVGLVEKLIFNIKKSIMQLFSGHPTVTSLFDLQHHLALIELFINKRPTYTWDCQFITPNIFQVAGLRYSQSSSGPQILSELIFPAGDTVREALHLIS